MKISYQTFKITVIAAGVLAVALLPFWPYSRWGYFPSGLLIAFVVLLFSLERLRAIERPPIEGIIMPRPHVRWDRVFAIYLGVAAGSLIAGACLRAPLHDILLTLGVCLGASFVPIVMIIYFLPDFARVASLLDLGTGSSGQQYAN